MSFTPAEYADGVWTHATRTVDAQAPATSNGSVIDDIAYAVWTYPTRTASGGVASFQITVAESMPAPSQSADAGTSIPVSIVETLLAPSQSASAQTSIDCVI